MLVAGYWLLAADIAWSLSSILESSSRSRVIRYSLAEQAVS
jgi:hypothetical protein